MNYDFLKTIQLEQIILLIKKLLFVLELPQHPEQQFHGPVHATEILLQEPHYQHQGPCAHPDEHGRGWQSDSQVQWPV